MLPYRQEILKHLAAIYAGMSIAQGGPGFPILADATYHYITTGETTGLKISNEDLPLQIKNVVNQVTRP